MKIYTDIVQSSPEWYELRLGRVTGTGFQKVLAKGQGKVRKSYMIQLAAERLSGLPRDTYSNAVMDRGNEVEPQARVAYEAIEGVSVLQVGFVGRNEDIGCSPDGLIGDDGCLECKCPNTTTHIETILSGKMPPKHMAQVQGLMWVADREYCDFVSFDPRMTAQRYFRVRVKRDEEYIKNLAVECVLFVNELKAMVKTITDKMPF